jgi:hypothetical protein
MLSFIVIYFPKAGPLKPQEQLEKDMFIKIKIG